ncbi:putative serine threonine-protein phosphatase 6 regulatory ankyrin repeat subunit A [Rosellinia necatrix]|uniref:Putative serine threonine-protein phosphatase 6 regulatory ankyrin repeat subunit A n=1 Tax=Rosellinia necatrix TaxID=77044 RepID=A0A1S8AAP8_ROSNE|nr:putative serine threonine-protein phosphatase 6 regulatory ankyrin repeat subunit A [Rosellinia necatrix]
MAPQLTLDILRLVANKTSRHHTFRDALNLSLVSRSVHASIYPIILRVDAAAESVYTPTHDCFFGVPPKTPRSLALPFFAERDNLALVVKQLENRHIDLNEIIHQGSGCRTILFTAIETDALSVVEFLLKRGASPSAGADHFHQPLWWAVGHGQVRMTRLLLEHAGLQAHVRDRNGYHTTSKTYDENAELLALLARGLPTADMARTLAQFSTDINQTNTDGLTVLHQVCRGKRHPHQLGVIRALVEEGASIDALTVGDISHGMFVRRTPLNYAVENAEFEVVRQLLRMGASPQGACEFGLMRSESSSQIILEFAAFTPMYSLLSQAHTKWEDEFIDFDDNWVTNVIFHWINAMPKIRSLARLLINYGISGIQGLLDANKKVIISFEFICAKIHTDSRDLWDLLLNGGAINVHHRNEYGQTSLSQIVSRCFGNTINFEASFKPNLIRALVDAGADLDTVDNSGMTPLHWAILYGDIDLVRLLVELGANPRKRVEGSTAVHHAFGKPFALHGSVSYKVLESLQREISEALQDDFLGFSGRFGATSLEQTCGWHPLVHFATSPALRNSPQRTYMLASEDAEKRLLATASFLWSFADTTEDDDGKTPREIAMEIGILKEGDVLVYQPAREPPVRRIGLMVFGDEHKTYTSHLRSTRFTGSRCDISCQFCWLIPQPLLDLDTGRTRPPGSPALSVTSESGVYLRPATVAQFR